MVSSISISLFLEFDKEKIHRRNRNISPSQLDDFNSIGFLNRAHNGGLYVAGPVQIKREHIIRLKFGVGLGSNTKALLLSLWGLLWFAKRRRVHHIKMVGDSKSVID